MRLVCCAYLVIFFLCAASMLKQYGHALAGLGDLRAGLVRAPVETLQSFCAGTFAGRDKLQLFALQCQQAIATRQHQDVCANTAHLSSHPRRYYYLELDCRLHSKILRMQLPKVRQVIYHG